MTIVLSSPIHNCHTVVPRQHLQVSFLRIDSLCSPGLPPAACLRSASNPVDPVKKPPIIPSLRLTAFPPHQKVKKKGLNCCRQPAARVIERIARTRIPLQPSLAVHADTAARQNLTARWMDHSLN